MQSLRISLLLGFIAVGLLGFILWIERGSLTSSELEHRKQSALPTLVRARVSQLEIQRAGKTVVLVRETNDDESTVWNVQAPYRAKADQDAVDSLLGALEFIDARRRIEGITPADRKRFGFDKPRDRLWFTVGNARVPVVVGNESPRGDGVYVQSADPRVAFVVGKEVTETLAQDPEHYHTRELHEGVQALSAVELSFRGKGGERVVRKSKDGVWQLKTPALGLASEPAISGVVEALDALRAKHFVAAAAKDLHVYGLDQPRVELSVRTTPWTDKTKAQNDKAPDTSPAEHLALRLRVGQACPNYPGESYATADDAGTVSCVLDADVEKLDKPLAELRETRLLPLDSDAVASLQLERGDLRLLLTRAEERWSYETLRAGHTELKAEARAGSVTEWLEALRNTKAERWIAQPPSTPGPSDLVTLRVEAGKDKSPYAVRIDASKREALLAQRGSEPELAVFPAAARDLLTPNAARFRSLDIAQLAEPSLREIEIRRDGQLERLSRSAPTQPFLIDAPLRAQADTSRIDELTRMLGSLQALRFLADASADSHGLAAPALSLSVGYLEASKDAPVRRLVLRIGDRTDGGRFAQIEGQAGVFVLPSQLIELISEPLLSRTALAIPLEQIASIEAKGPGRTIRVERSGTNFESKDPTVAPAQARGMAEALATLRASRIASYGPAESIAGMNQPYARLTVSTEHDGSSEHHTITLGASAPSGRYARRDDLPASFVLPSSSVDALLLPGTAKSAP